MNTLLAVLLASFIYGSISILLGIKAEDVQYAPLKFEIDKDGLIMDHLEIDSSLLMAEKRYQPAPPSNPAEEEL